MLERLDDRAHHSSNPLEARTENQSDTLSHPACWIACSTRPQPSSCGTRATAGAASTPTPSRPSCRRSRRGASSPGGRSPDNKTSNRLLTHWLKSANSDPGNCLTRSGLITPTLTAAPRRTVAAPLTWDDEGVTVCAFVTRAFYWGKAVAAADAPAWARGIPHRDDLLR